MAFHANKILKLFLSLFISVFQIGIFTIIRFYTIYSVHGGYLLSNNIKHFCFLLVVKDLKRPFSLAIVRANVALLTNCLRLQRDCDRF